jgi:hypothetical protein
VLDDLHEHNLLHFKGATDELERTDALQVLSYAYQYMALHDLRTPAVMSLRVVAPTLTPRFRAQLTALGGALVETEVRGVHVGHLQGFALRVVETSVAWSTPGEHLLFAISPACLTAPEHPRGFDDTERDVYYRLLQGITQLSQDPRWKAIMKDATLVGETASQALMDLLAVIPPEQRLAGLAPEQRLAGLAPEQRLAGLAPEQRLAGLAPEQRLAGLSEADRVLALPDAALRALPAEYLATLPPTRKRASARASAADPRAFVSHLPPRAPRGRCPRVPPPRPLRAPVARARSSLPHRPQSARPRVTPTQPSRPATAVASTRHSTRPGPLPARSSTAPLSRVLVGRDPRVPPSHRRQFHVAHASHALRVVRGGDPFVSPALPAAGTASMLLHGNTPDDRLGHRPHAVPSHNALRSNRL